MSIDWTDPTAKISNHFTVREATWLPSWGCCHIPNDEEQANILKMASKMDQVRDLLGKPINVHVWIRPGAANCPGSLHDGEDYNAAIGGAAHSAHKVGSAVDWDCGENCDVTRATLETELDRFCLCMERKPGGNWVHLDDFPPRGATGRYFVP